jgi:hypothetical protein
MSKRNSLYATTQPPPGLEPPPPSASMGVDGCGEGSGSAKTEEIAKRDAKESIDIMA